MHFIDGNPVTQAEWLRHMRADEEGTPSAFINGKEVVGHDQIRDEIDRAMRRSLHMHDIEAETC